MYKGRGNLMPIVTNFHKYEDEYVKKVLDCDMNVLFDDVEARYVLTIDLNNDKIEEVTYILKNPSQATYHNSDQTINKIICLSYKLGMGKINIVNLYPYYKTDSKFLYKLIEKVNNHDKKMFNNIQDKNFDIIDDLLTNSSKVVVGWGERPKKIKMKSYQNEIRKVYSLLTKNNFNSYYVLLTHLDGHFTKDKQPFHPIRKRLDGIHPYELGTFINML